MKKTVKVASVLERVNFLLMSENFNAVQKDAISGVLESILHETDNYSGYADSIDLTARHYYASKALAGDVLEYKAERRKNGGLR